MQRKIRSDVEVRDVAQRMTLRLLSLPVGDLAACPAVAAVRDALRRFAAMGGRAGGHEAGLAAVPELRCCIAWSLSTRRVARPRLDLLRLPPEDAEGKAAPREVDALLDRAAGQRAALSEQVGLGRLASALAGRPTGHADKARLDAAILADPTAAVDALTGVPTPRDALAAASGSN